MRNAVAVALSVIVMGAAIPVSSGAAMREDQPAGGTIQGVARDAQHQPLRSLVVRIRDVRTGQLAASGATSTSGQFAIAGLRPGSYVVEVLDSPGRIIATTSPLAIAAGAVESVNVTASPAPGAAVPSSSARLFGAGTVLGVAGAATAIGVTAMVVTKNNKVVICHKPGGQPAQTIEISENAKDAHLAHGDTLGACPISPSR